jgi:hypothetical protein|tara:strand:- start:699 stop:851 length:153 start_codon:yes stop_codon:yes gene_type:complete
MKNNRILREIFWKSIKQKLDKVAELLIANGAKKLKLPISSANTVAERLKN